MSEQRDPVQAMVDAMLASEEPKPEAAAAKADEDGGGEEQGSVVEQAASPEAEGKEERLVPFSELNKEIAGKAKLRAERRELRDEVSRLKAELESLKGGNLPDVDDFETAEEYEEALKKHEAASKTAANPTFVQARDTLFEQKEDWSDAPDDWFETISDNTLPFTEDFVVLVSDLENGAKVLYELARNRDALNKIVGKRTEAMRIRELERFEKSLGVPEANSMAVSTPKQKPVVSAIDPVGGGSKGRTSLESLSVEDHLAAVRSRSRF